MSILRIGNRDFAAGLQWRQRGRMMRVLRDARVTGCSYFVHWRHRTGYVSADASGNPEGLPSLAAALLSGIEEQHWMALVEAADGRLVLITVGDGELLAGGDQVFEDRETAVAALEEGRSRVDRVFAAPGLLEDAAELDLSELQAAPEFEVREVPFRFRPRTAAAAALAACLVVALAVAWSQREAIRVALLGPLPTPPQPESRTEQTVSVTVDSAGLVEACGRAQVEFQPSMLAWEMKGLACHAEFGDANVLAVLPDLKDRPVMLVRWQLQPGYTPALHRQLLERQLSRWHAGSVTGSTAWGLVVLVPVLRTVPEASPRPPSQQVFRSMVDRAWGLSSDRIEYVDRSGAMAVIISTRQPLSRVAELVAKVPALEVQSVSRGVSSAWSIEGRAAVRRSLTRTVYEKVTGDWDA